MDLDNKHINNLKPTIVIITGLPCTGKTILAKKIESTFNIKLLTKDDFKEILFEKFGCNNREWSKKIGATSYDILYLLAEKLMKTKDSFIIESNFHPVYSSEILNILINKYDYYAIQIRCFTEGNLLFERFKIRANSSNRHPGHLDKESINEWEPVLKKSKIDKLDINSTFIDIDTSQFDQIDYKKIYNIIKMELDSKLLLEVK